MKCLNEETVVAFVRGKLDGAALASVEEHLSVCADCRAIVAGASRLLPPRGASPDPLSEDTAAAPDSQPARGSPARGSHRLLAAGQTVSRYVIEEPLGAGSAGIVYRAHDPQLLRHVALKVLPPAAVPGDAQARWLREAQVMAQLSHPNVVAVHDVGLHQGSVFIAMELVKGRTITQWLNAQKRDWRDILAVFLEAAKGLAAAHAAGIVHRDFKLDNVIAADDGRTCVVDFGLARPLHADAGDAGRTDPPVHEARPDGLAMNLTSVGTLVGTPAYMAPEQFRGRELDARSDQFSFCVALHFALFGTWPYGLGMAKDAVQEDMGAAPENTGVPRPVHDVLRRGLMLDPMRRYASMDDLIAALHRVSAGDVRAAARRKRVYAASIGLGLALAGSGAWLAGRAPAPDVCGDGKVRAHVEECDDGNLVDGDGCSAQCLACRVGDRSLVWTGNGHCYSLHTAAAAWDDARLACARAGGADLATLISGYERSAVVSLLADVTVPTWIGFRRDSGPLAMVTGEIPDGQYNWAPGEPGERDGCVFQKPLNEGKSEFIAGILTLWAIGDCGRAMAHVCERAPWSIRARGQHAYRLVTQPVTWDRARDTCRSLGGHLATVTDGDEQLFIRTEATLDAWIGAGDHAVAGTFDWVTGEPFSYQYFAGREPDNQGERPPNCLVMDPGGRWHDRKCDDPNAFLCEIDWRADVDPRP